jgi:hypothetical protein
LIRRETYNLALLLNVGIRPLQIGYAFFCSFHWHSLRKKAATSAQVSKTTPVVGGSVSAAFA